MGRNRQVEMTDSEWAEREASRRLFSRTVASVCLGALLLSIVFAYIFRDYSPASGSAVKKNEVPVITAGHPATDKK